MANILVVDDETAIRTLLKISLEKEGHKVWEADSGITADELLNTQAIDLMITDIIMPGLGGVDLIRDSRSGHPDLKVIAISGQGRVKAEILLKMAEDVGAITTFAKPFEMRALVEEIEKLLSS